MYIEIGKPSDPVGSFAAGRVSSGKLDTSHLRACLHGTVFLFFCILYLVHLLLAGGGGETILSNETAHPPPCLYSSCNIIHLPVAQKLYSTFIQIVPTSLSVPIPKKKGQSSPTACLSVPTKTVICRQPSAG